MYAQSYTVGNPASMTLGRAELFDQPFFYEQRLEMDANRVPLGAL